MSSKFYISIIEEEKTTFNTKDDALKKAAKDVAKVYSQEALKNGSTFLDYNNPPNRCAYLFKFAAVHTELTAKYFQKLTNKKKILDILKSKKHLRICSLGGGPGTDVVGIFKSMAIIPSLHKKVVQVTVLDICGGWRNSFKHVISRLKHGKVAGVPASFIDANNFNADLIAVDLLKTLPENIRKIISSADIISMVKFVSAVAGIEGSIEALKAIANISKPGATIFFIDNFYNKVFEPLINISKDCGLDTTLGPLQEVYIKSPKKTIKPKATAYGCPPLNCTRISVISWTKTSETNIDGNSTFVSQINTNSNEENDWDTDSDSEESQSSTHLQTKNDQKDSLTLDQTKMDPFRIDQTKNNQNNPLRLDQTKNDQKKSSKQIEPKNDQIDTQLQIRSVKTEPCRQTKVTKMDLCSQLQALGENFKKLNIQADLSPSNAYLDKSTQTDVNDASVNEIELAELQDLIDATSELIRVMNRLNLRDNNPNCCHGCTL
ncbi:hypothetical protein JTE90_010659 [Oedothorax gibbosus]|uniref:Uncharacterized protein n=1 Tax=Oedothorax gibbosus TaxID=931172 RepID=A0AAV6UQP3_9ARAC|nr:hypothetical protein JTE90_010659 [Oedothorax gibbosus]